MTDSGREVGNLFLRLHPQKGVAPQQINIWDSAQKNSFESFGLESLHSEISCEKPLISPGSPACNQQPEIQFGVEHLFPQQSLLMEDEQSDVCVVLGRANSHSISWKKEAALPRSEPALLIGHQTPYQ